jgi:hypothetical protein
MDNSTHERFWAQVDKTETCWIWSGYKSTNGYGRARHNGKQVQAHRVSWEDENGPIPAGKVLDHICHNRACVRPEHLRVTTHKQNMEHRARAQSNSKSGVLGVSWSTPSKKWRVDVKHNRKTIYGGRYSDLAEAEQAAIEIRNRLFTHNNADRIAA